MSLLCMYSPCTKAMCLCLYIKEHVICTMYLQGLKITMKKHPSAFKLQGELEQKLTTVKDQPLTLYEGT